MDNMLRIIDGFSASGYYTPSYSPENFLLSLLMAFVLGQLVAWVYYVTHSGLSYSRTYVQSLILITVVVAMVMSTIANSFVAAVGVMGALSIIRFRNMLKDTRDVAFIFIALVVGMASGYQRFSIAIIGAFVLCAIALYLHLSGFGTHQPHNGFLRFRYTGLTGPDYPVPDILKRYCSSFTLISVQDAGFGNPAEYAYQLMVRNAARNDKMISELEKVVGIENVSLTMQEQLLEV